MHDIHILGDYTTPERRSLYPCPELIEDFIRAIMDLADNPLLNNDQRLIQKNKARNLCKDLKYKSKAGESTAEEIISFLKQQLPIFIYETYKVHIEKYNIPIDKNKCFAQKKSWYSIPS